MGQVCSYKDATQVFGILPGSLFVIKQMIPHINKTLIQAWALIEGCTPIDDLKPSEHHFVHYGGFTITHSLLCILWMMGFERYNKYLKNHVHHSHHPLINLAKTSTRTDTANFFDMMNDEDDEPELPRSMYLK